jgi:septum site-determining protein MinD
MGRVILVSSGKGGVGKTNTTVNLGVALTELGNKVAIVDGSLTTPDVSLHLGIPFHVQGLSDILKYNVAIKAASFQHKSGLVVIPGNIHEDILKEFEGKKLNKVLKKLRRKNDFVLIDCSAGIGRETVSVLKASEEMLVITNPELPAVVNASKLIQTAKEHNVKIVGVVVNRVGRFKAELKHEEDIAPLLHKVPIIGWIREDKKVAKSTKRSEAVLNLYPKSKLSKQYRNLAESVASNSKRKGSKKQENFFQKVVRIFKE